MEMEYIEVNRTIERRDISGILMKKIQVLTSVVVEQAKGSTNIQPLN